ncbi:MAG: NAD(P)-binding domain-containing protein [Acidobacteriota bacterium]|nr:NAD(P)-binding domain-containing protein [Acidobacteriota bacterium]
METTDVAIVGAGPIGIELAVALRRKGLDYRHFEAGQIGATIAWYAPFTRFFSSPERIAIAGVPLQTVDQNKATREEYLNYLRGVVQQFDLEIHTGQKVEEIEGDGDGFVLLIRRQHVEHRLRARRVVLAIGDMHRPQLLGIPGEDLPHVSHYLAEPHEYFRRRLLIVGGKNSAVEAAIRCRRIGSRVTLSYRGPGLDEKRIKFWLMPEIRAMIREGHIDFLPNTVPRQILPDRVVLERTAEAASDEGSGVGEALEVPADQVLLLTGYSQDPTLFERAGIELEGPGRKPKLDEETMETNVPGLYVAGTAVAGTQLRGVRHFIETSHVHVDRIVAHLAGGRAVDAPTPQFELPES